MPSTLTRRPPWPLPALLAWLLAWAAFVVAGTAGLPAAAAFVLAALTGAGVAALADGAWRRTLAAAGFPVSALALGALPALPAWVWLAGVAPLLLAYPLRAWRDAPFFPTPVAALVGLDRHVTLAPGGRVLDAGCGLGHGLQALRRVWPQARLQGLEFSRPLAWCAARRCPDADITRADMWAASWAQADLVYLFQRPESMARAMAKAEAEMAPGSWLVSLEFEVPARQPVARLGEAGQRPVWVYRIAAATDARPSTGRAARR
jgi:SAM-dependent methyltransferase